MRFIMKNKMKMRNTIKIINFKDFKNFNPEK